MAKNYIDNLSEEARKDQQEKAEQGIWPSKAPLVHRRTGGPLPVSNMHILLRNRLFTEEYDWNGRRYRGRHLPW